MNEDKGGLFQLLCESLCESELGGLYSLPHQDLRVLEALKVCNLQTYPQPHSKYSKTIEN